MGHVSLRAQRGILLHWDAYRASRVCLIVRKYAAATSTFRGRWETHGDRAVQIRRGVEKRGQVRVQYGDAASYEQDLTKELAAKTIDVRLLSSITEWRSSSALGS